MSLSDVPSVVREARSWGWEVKYGTWNLEDTVARGEGTKPVALLNSAKDVGVAYVTSEHRAKTGAGRRIIVSAWMSFPVNVGDKADVRRRMVRASRVLRRLIVRKRKRYLREYEP